KNIRARDATEQNVADDNDMEVLDLAAFLPDCVDIEKTLSGMFVRAVAGVDHARFQLPRQKLRRAGGTVAQDENVGMHGLEIASGVFERFAFGQTRRCRGNVDHIGAQAVRGQLERGARARARFNEEVDQRFTAKRRDFFDLASADLFEGICGLENEIDLVRGKFAKPEQIFAVPIRAHSLHNQTASGSWSTSWRRT